MLAEQTVGILGYGRFGKLLAKLLEAHFKHILINDPDEQQSIELGRGCKWTSLPEVMTAGTVFLAVPIHRHPALLTEIAPLCKPGQLIIDVASVKTQIRDWMESILPESVQILNTHPMFGPDSIDRDPDLKLVYCPTRITAELDEAWKQEFQSWGCRLIVIDPEEHDRQAARSQGLTHFIGRVMQDMGIEQTEVDTHGFRQVHHVVEQTCQDTDELFRDLQNYNPNTPEMLQSLRKSIDRVEGNLFRRERHTLRIGYQGVPGSFSDEASRKLCSQEGVSTDNLIPCVSSAGVLDALDHYRVDIGVVAMENAQGGVVHESIHALAAGRCRIARMFHLQVRQCLLVKEGLELQGISAVHSHLQAFKQCSRYLEEQFGDTDKMEAEDTALAAQHLSEGVIPATAAVIAPARAAELYGLSVLASNIQDLEDNKTLFLALIRPGSGIQLQTGSTGTEV